jgi:WD40 repeat protein
MLAMLPPLATVPDSSSNSGSSSITGSSIAGIPGVIAATASEDCSCRLWDLSTGKQLEVLQVIHAKFVTV